jgi:hypothetical protein
MSTPADRTAATATVTVTVDRWELAQLIGALMVLEHQMTRIPSNDLSELPRLEALRGRLTSLPVT